MVYRAAFSFTAGDEQLALDATQEAFSRAFARWNKLRRSEWAGGWVTTTALNICRRGMGRREGSLEAERIAPQGDTDLRIDVASAVATLPLKQRQAALLYYLADLPVSAVAELMKTSEGSVKTHLSRARKALEQRLDTREVRA